MTSLTVVSVLVHGEYPYTPDYVRRLYAMVTRWCDRPFRFCCLTDQPDAMPVGVEAIPITKFAGCFALWSKLQVFDPRHGFVGRVLYLDLDTLIVAPLDPIIDFPADLALTADALMLERAHLDRDRYGRRLVRRFNGSVMVWDGGTQTDLCTTWRLADAQRLSTDQDWISERATHAKGMNLEWFPRISRLTKDEAFAATGAPMPADAKIILCKKPKNHQAILRWPWIDAVWGGAAA